MNFIKVEQFLDDAAGDKYTVQVYLNLDNAIAVYPDSNLVMTNASLNSPRELAYMTLTDESFDNVLKAITNHGTDSRENDITVREYVDKMKFEKVLTKEEIAELRKEMGDDANGV